MNEESILYSCGAVGVNELDHDFSRPEMFHVALWEPEIPPNTGNIARLCAATGTELHLIEPLGYRLDSASLRRAGLDYWEFVTVRLHKSLADFERAHAHRRIFIVSARVTRPHTSFSYQDEDVFLFGKESLGLPPEVHVKYADRALTIPMPAAKVRCLNLSTAAGIVLYEALRQTKAWPE